MYMLYCLHDSDPELKKKGMFPVTPQQAQELNAQGYGVFWTPNVFNGQRRASNLKEIRFWIADIDGGDKETQWLNILNLPLIPSAVVESKNGFHCYWKAKDALYEHYREIETGIINRLNADKACKDVCRVLRCPNYYHLKNVEEPFLVKTILMNDNVYTDEEMCYCYRVPKPVYKPVEYKGDKQGMLEPDNWEKLFHISGAMAEGRNNFLTRVTFWLKDEGFDRSTIENTIYNMNNSLATPLENWEVKVILRTKL